MSNVPCNGCTLCCRADAVRLLPGDDPEQYQTEQHPFIDGELMLAHKPNGDCVYLGDDGCTIHERKPQQCQEMDCRLLAQVIPFTKARKLSAKNGVSMSVWRKGKALSRLEVLP